jgi:hypothetical protein
MGRQEGVQLASHEAVLRDDDHVGVVGRGECEVRDRALAGEFEPGLVRHHRSHHVREQ